MKWITDNGIVCYSIENALHIQKLLIQEGYVCMLSVEDDLYILNYVSGSWDSHNGRVYADRNAVIFRNREDFEEEWFSEENIDASENFSGEWA